MDVESLPSENDDPRDVRGTSNGWIQMFSGARLNPLNPDPAQITLDDMLRGMARENRFSGQTSFPYSVAQHCVHLSRTVLGQHMLVDFTLHDLRHAPWTAIDGGLELVGLSEDERAYGALRALLHDGAEGLGMRDLARPIKHDPAMASYRSAEAFLQLVVYQRFGIRGPDPRWLKSLDNVLGCTEQRQLQPHTCPESKRVGLHVDLQIPEWSESTAMFQWRRMYAVLTERLGVTQ